MSINKNDPKVIEKSLNKLFSPEWILIMAKETGFIISRRKALTIGE